MRHTREEVIKRTLQEFERLDHLVKNLADEDWKRPLTRPETKDPWTVKDGSVTGSAGRNGPLILTVTRATIA